MGSQGENDDRHIFSKWSDAELKEYIQENSGLRSNPFLPADRQHLVAEAAKLSRRAEEQIFTNGISKAATSSAPPAPPLPGPSGAGPSAPAVGIPVGGPSVGTPLPQGYHARANPGAGPPGPAPYAGPSPVGQAMQPQPQIPGPRPYVEQPPIAGFPPTGRKKALVCGCNYRGSASQLQGCINDAHCMRHLLVTRFGFPPAAITLLTDDAPAPAAWPTRAAILWHMQALVAGARPGDSLVFHFSGHGMQVSDRTGDEDDGMNEALAPCDFRLAGVIEDDDINHILVNPLPQGVRLHAVVDACHSGTVFDLEFRCKVKATGIHWRTEYSRRPTFYKGTSGGEVIQFGASRDKQTAADTNQLSGVSTGAATFAFIQAIEQWGTRISYGNLLHSMTVTLNQIQPSSSFAGSSLGGTLGRLLDSAMDAVGMSGQKPVMAANWPFDVSRLIAI